MNFTHRLDDRLPFLPALLFGLQWTAVTVPLLVILGKVVGAVASADPAGETLYLQKLFFFTGATTLAQVLWGHRLPLIAGPSAVLLIGVLTSRGADPAAVYTAVAAGGLLILLVAAAGLFRYVQRVFTPRVVAAVLLLIAFSLAPAIRNLILGGPASGPLFNLLFALSLILVMFGLNRVLTGMAKATLIVWSLLLGSLAYTLLAPAGAAAAWESPPWWAGFFSQLLPRLTWDPGVLASFCFCFLALVVNDLGSLQSLLGLLSPSEPERRLTRGLVGTGLANLASGLGGVIGPVNYSLSPGVILASGCASRWALVPAAALVTLLAWSPAAVTFLGRVPPVVVGAVLTYIMASQVAAGLLLIFQSTAGRGFSLEDGLTLGLPTLLGTLIAFIPPEILDQLPAVVRPLLGNGFVVGVGAVLFLEHLIFRRRTGPS